MTKFKVTMPKKKGPKKGVNRIEALKAKMTKEQIAEAERLSAETDPMVLKLAYLSSTKTKGKRIG